MATRPSVRCWQVAAGGAYDDPVTAVVCHWQGCGLWRMLRPAGLSCPGRSWCAGCARPTGARAGPLTRHRACWSRGTCDMRMLGGSGFAAAKQASDGMVCCRAVSVARSASMSALHDQRWLGGSIVNQQKNIRMGLAGSRSKPKRTERS